MTGNERAEESEITVSLVVGEDTLEGCLDHTTRTGIVVSFGNTVVRSVPIPTKLAIALNGGQLKKPIELEGNAILWRSAERGEALKIEVAPDHLKSIEAAVRTDRADRVAMRGPRAIRVQLSPVHGDLKFEAVLIDFSVTGMALIVSEPNDQSLAVIAGDIPAGEPWCLRLSVTLPGNKSELRVIGELSYRLSMRSCIKYGVRFDLEETRAEYPDDELDLEEQMKAYLLQAKDSAGDSRAA